MTDHSAGSDRENAPSGGAGNDRIPRILLLPQVHERAINRAEDSSPSRELHAQEWTSRPDFPHDAEHLRAFRRVAIAADRVEEGPADQAHRERAAHVVRDAPRAARGPDGRDGKGLTRARG